MIEVRRLESRDVDDASTILYEAFASVYRRRGHTPPFPNVESAVWLCRAYLDLDPEGCALAAVNGATAGVGFAHLRGKVASIGPPALAPSWRTSIASRRGRRGRARRRRRGSRGACRGRTNRG